MDRASVSGAAMPPINPTAGRGQKPVFKRMESAGALGLGIREGNYLHAVHAKKLASTDFDAILQEGLESMAKQVQAHHEFLMQARKPPIRPQAEGSRFSELKPSLASEEQSSAHDSFVVTRPAKATGPGGFPPLPGNLDESTVAPQGHLVKIVDVEDEEAEEAQQWEKTVQWLGPDKDSLAPHGGEVANSARSSFSKGAGLQDAPKVKVVGGFTLHERWENKSGKTSVKRLKEAAKAAVASALFQGEEDEEDEDSGSETESESSSSATQPGCLSRCAHRVRGWFLPWMISPNSVFRSCWDSLACIFVLYECIMIPLSFFNVGSDAIAWIVRIFWSMDFPLSTVTGYILPGDQVEMRPERVIPHYAKTWMTLDLSMLTVDWTEVAIGGVGSLNAARMGKTVKSLRMIRMMRLWRLLNVNQLPESVRVLIHHYFQTEVSRIVLGICKIFVFLVWVNHVLACSWYGVGDLSLEEGSWVLQERFQNVQMFALYMTSYHWSLTQFAGSTDVYPSNVYERSFAVCALCICYLLSASIVSSITTSMTRLSIARSKETTKLAALKEYLKENHISSRTALRVQRNAQYAMEEQKKRTPEEDIELLEFISEPLRVELRFEITMPWLRKYAPIRTVEEESPSFVRQMCYKTFGSTMLSRADVLFVSGVQSEQMFFFTTGKSAYVQDVSNREEFFGQFTQKSTVSAGDWACEASLWTTWQHVGTVRARTRSAVLTLDADQFQSLASHFKDALPFLHEYARRFLKVLNLKPREELTDLYDPEYEISIIARDSREAANETQEDGSFFKLKRGASNNLFSVVPTMSRRNHPMRTHNSIWTTGIFGRRRDRAGDKPSPLAGIAEDTRYSGDSADTHRSDKADKADDAE